MIGILFESKEWSSYALHENITEMGIESRLIDLEQDDNLDEILSCDMIINRVFASSIFRDHHKSLNKVPEIIDILKSNGIPMLNAYDAHFYEINKAFSTKTLEENGFMVPKVYGVFKPEMALECENIEYPCIAKPNCGGRTNFTYIINDRDELMQCMKVAPQIDFIIQEYIEPEYGFLTRIEVIDRCCKSILKRSVAENGLSAYHLGSTYTQYESCSDEIKSQAVEAMDLLQIEFGSMDIIENRSGFYIIDINSVSNASEDNIEAFSFDLMKETAEYIVKKYSMMKS